jgi:hypothetical protein
MFTCFIGMKVNIIQEYKGTTVSIPSDDIYNKYSIKLTLDHGKYGNTTVL